MLKKTTYEVSANLVVAEPSYGMGKNPNFAIFKFLAKKAHFNVFVRKMPVKND